jgi:hypothetical protein
VSFAAGKKWRERLKHNMTDQTSEPTVCIASSRYNLMVRLMLSGTGGWFGYSIGNGEIANKGIQMGPGKG